MSKTDMRDWTLLEIVDRKIATAGSRSVNTILNLRYACLSFNRYFGRQATVRDVTFAALDAFAAWNITKGVSTQTARSYLWRVSGAVRHVDESLLPRRMQRVQRVQRFDGDATLPADPANWPLVQVVEQWMGPTGAYTRQSLNSYRAACRRFCRFLGSTALVRDVTPDRLAGYAAWKREQGIATDDGRTIAMIARRAAAGAAFRFRQPNRDPLSACHRGRRTAKKASKKGAAR